MKNRNLFYTQEASGGFFNPNMNYMNNLPNNFNTMPSGFNKNTNYMAFGPNIGPNGNMNYMNNDDIIYENNNNWNEFESRLTKLERMYRKLDSRISKLESSSNVVEDVTNNYII